MELPSLRLTVEKGPRKWETLDCKPGNVSRIGRVIKGNHLAVRDPGVSQKHLAFEFLPEASRWAVSDLDTSNGTLVNGCKIPPSAPFPLSDGDTVKIGESTSISVRILAAEMRDIDGGRDDEESSRLRPRRGRSRRGAAPLPAVEEIAADVAQEVRIVRGRGRPKRTAAPASANPTKDEILEPRVVEESTEVGAKVAPVAKGRARGRRATTRSAAAKVSESEEAMEDPHDLVPGAATTKSAAAKVSENEEEMADPRDSVPVAATTMTSASSKASEEEKEYPHGSVPVADSKSVEATGVNEMGDDVVGNNAAEEAAGDGGREELPKEYEKEVAEDMEKMTLGEWFDRIEKILPLMINDVAQETIDNLRDKARRFDEFIATSSAAV